METLEKNLTMTEIIGVEDISCVEKKPTAQEDLMEYLQRENPCLVIPPETNIISERKKRNRGFATLGSTLEPRSFPGIVENTKNERR